LAARQMSVSSRAQRNTENLSYGGRAMQNRRQRIGVWVAVGIAVGIAVGTAAGAGADGIFPWIIGGAFVGALVGAGILKRRS